jgi:Uma2 family endonuclease
VVNPPSTLDDVQNPIRAGEHDEPEPDVVFLKPRADDYGVARATPDDILLLVEVSDRTLRKDLGRKARIYATAGVQEYWVVDLNNQVVYLHRLPGVVTYESRIRSSRGDTIAAQIASWVQVTIEDLLA